MKQVFQFILFLTITLVISACQVENEKERLKVVTPKNWNLVWSDEFDKGEQPDTNSWTYDLGDGCPNLCGWGNKEKQYYTNDFENVSIADGLLKIKAIHNPSSENPYTSARLLTKGKQAWKYGRVEARAKLPKGRGTWPAIWMLPEDWTYGGWPNSGEIDIMEHVGAKTVEILGTVHTKDYNHMLGTQKGGSIDSEDCESEFHVYGIEWSADKIDFFIDSQIYYTFSKVEDADFGAWPFDQRFHFIVNLAIGGNLGGTKGIDDSAFPMEMLIDYVRVFEIKKDE